MRKVQIFMLVSLALLFAVSPVMACHPPGDSTLKDSGAKWEIYCTPEDNIYVRGHGVTVTLGGTTEKWGGTSGFQGGDITGPSPNNVLIVDNDNSAILFNAVVNCGDPVDPPDEPTDPPCTEYGDPADMIRLTADNPASPIVVYSPDEDECVMVLYGYDGTYLQGIEFSELSAAEPGDLMVSVDGPDGSRADLYFMGIDGDSLVQYQLNIYNPDGTYTEFPGSVMCFLAEAPNGGMTDHPDGL